MHFSFELVEQLPALAWCVEMHVGESHVKVVHGVGVDCHDRIFFEGCWDGDLTAEALRDAGICAATGAGIFQDKVVLVTPTNTLVRLYAIRKGKRLWFSNSMAFVVISAEEALDENYIYYQEDISSVIEGLNKSVKSIPLQSGLNIDFYFHCNIEVTEKLEVQASEKANPPDFKNFSDYRRFLSDGLAGLVSNANLPGRKMQFRPLVSISRGYDSVTCAVLGKEVGCTEAVTMFDPESDAPDADNGSDIAKSIGLNVTTYSRVAYKELSAECEFFAVGTGGEDIFFASMENMLSGRIFISGFHGDKVWDKHPEKISDQIVRGDPSGADLEEFRLRVGFIHVAVPFFGCRSHSEIVRISQSPEMAQWSIGGDYDRPICRRIAEEAGISRSSFGQKKRVMSRSFGQRGLEWYFGKDSLRSFQDYLSRQDQPWRGADIAMNYLACTTNNLASTAGRVSYRLEKAIRKLTTPLRRYQQALDNTRKMFPWAFEKLLGRYRAALIQR